MPKGKSYSILSGLCPQCRSGKVFSHPFYNLVNFSEVNKNCPHCGVKFESEVGFFWGAMYFTYALNVMVSVVTGFTFFFLFNDPELWVYVSGMIPLTLLLTPPMMRLSRLLMMYLVAPYRRYDKEAGK